MRPEGRGAKALGCLFSLLLALGLWLLLARRLPPILLPAPGETAKAFLELVREPGFGATVLVSTLRALGAFLGALVAGVAGGVLAAHLPWVRRILRPWMLGLLGTPPVAWMVLALLWFGSGHLTPLLTVWVTLLPGLFLGALEAERALDPALVDMARSFGASRWRNLVDLRLPNLASRLRPVLSTSLGTAWKALVMVELLANGEGLGFRLGEARASVEVARALGWVLVMVLLVMTTDGLLRLLLGFGDWRARRGAEAGACPEPEVPGAKAGALRLEAVHFGHGDEPLFLGLDLSVQGGERVALVGASGVGKSTLLRLAQGLVQQGGGAVRNTFPRTAVVFQEPRLLPWATAVDNAAFGLVAAGVPRPEARHRAARLLLELGLAEGDGAKRPEALSGGMAGRVALARALLVAPDLLLLDEPAAAFDPGLRRVVQDRVVEASRARGMAVLWITHDLLEALRVAERICLLDGRPAAVTEDLPVTPTSDPAERHAQAADLLRRPAFQRAFSAE